MSGAISIRGLVAALAAIAIAAGSIGCASDEEKVAEHMARGQEYLAAGKPKEGLIEFKNALRISPQNAEINFRIARLLDDQGQFGQALFFYGEAARLDPTMSDALLSQASLLAFDDPDRSQELIESVLEREPANALAFVRLSELELARADSTAALEAATTAIELEPGNGYAHLNLGIVHRARIREQRLLDQADEEALHQTALSAFEKGIELLAEDEPQLLVRGWLERALVLAEWKTRSGEAGAAFREAAEVGSRYPGAEQRVLESAIGHARRKQDRELLAWALERSVEISPRSLPAWRQLARFERIEGRSAAAVFERLAKQSPESARAQVAYARSLDEESHQDALAHLHEVAAETDDPAVAWGALIQLHLAAGELEEAEEVLARLQRDHPEHPRSAHSEAHFALAAGRSADAAEILRRLVESEESAEAFQSLALAEHRLGNRRAATAAVDRAIALQGEPVPIRLLTLGARIQVASGDWRAAIRSYRLASRRAGGSLQLEDVPRLARALYETGRPKAARKQLETALARPDAPREAFLLYASRESERDPKRVFEILRQADERFPGDPEILRQLAQRDLRDKRPQDALQRVDSALSEGPERPGLWLLRARVLVAIGRLEEAAQASAKALELSPDMPQALALHVGLLRAQGREDELMASFESARRGGELNLGERIVFARLLMEREQYAPAIPLLEDALREQENLPGVKNDLAFALARQSTDLDRAFALAQDARAANPNAAQFADTLGYVFLRRQLPEAAVDQFRAALELYPNQDATWSSFQYHLGLGLRDLGRTEEAAEAFEKALATASEFPEADEARRELEALSGAGLQEEKSAS